MLSIFTLNHFFFFKEPLAKEPAYWNDFTLWDTATIYSQCGQKSYSIIYLGRNHILKLKSNHKRFFSDSLFQAFLFLKHIFIYTCFTKNCMKSLCPLTAHGGGGSKPKRTRLLRMQVFLTCSLTLGEIFFLFFHKYYVIAQTLPLNIFDHHLASGYSLRVFDKLLWPVCVAAASLMLFITKVTFFYTGLFYDLPCIRLWS